MSNTPTISRIWTACLGVAVVAAAALVPRSAAQSPSAKAARNFGSAHGACGPGQPYIERFTPAMRHLAPYASVAAAARGAVLVLVGAPVGFRTRVTRQGEVHTVASFRHPLLLKSYKGGPQTGAATVRVEFRGGTAMVQGHCTEGQGPTLRKSQLYLIFAIRRNEGRLFSWFAFPVDPHTGAVGGALGTHQRHIVGVIAETRAVVAKQRAKGKGGGGQ